MTFTVVIIIAVTVLAAGLILMACSFGSLNHKISLYQNAQQERIDNLNQTIKLYNDYFIAAKNGYDTCRELVCTFKEQYDNIYASYEALFDQYNKLLKAWHKIENGYSEVYEQFRMYNTQFDRMTINEIKNGESIRRIDEKVDKLIEQGNGAHFGHEIRDGDEYE